MSVDQKRVTAAQQAYDDAVREERVARIAAADQLRTRARRRRAGLRLLALASGLVGAVLLGFAVAGVFAERSAQSELDRWDGARGGAVTAISTMLSADPAEPGEYVDRVLAVTTGEQRERLTSARDDLRGAVAELGAVSTGHVISSGVQRDPAQGEGATVPVVVVAQASDPELIGGVAGSDRVVVRVMMVQSEGRWLVESTERVS